MNEKAPGTNGGRAVTSGARRQRLLWLVLAFILFATVQGFAHVESTRTDFARAGIAETALHVWIWELTGIVAWIVLLPAIGWMVTHARPPRLAWPWAALAHAAVTVPLSAAHVAGMIGMRIAVYALMGERYGYGDLADRFLYEYRKDAASYLLLACFMAFAIWLLAAPQAGEAEVEVIHIQDGSITHRVPVDAIDWAASAGNYVEIAWGQRMLLHRSTLAALAETLGSGFARIHRGRIVRRAAILRIETDRSGDFTVTLASGAELRGSRRYRASLG